MKQTFKTFVLLAILFGGGIARVFSQPVNCANAGQIVEVIINLPSSLPAGDYQFDFNNGSGTQIPLCFCPVTPNPLFPPPFNTCTGNIVGMEVTATIGGIANTTPIFPKRGRVGCGGMVLETGVFVTFNGTATGGFVKVRVRIPNGTPCNRTGNISMGLFKRYNPGGFVLYSSHSGSFKTCLGPALAKPTDIYMSSPNTFNCTWNISTYPVLGATSYAWTFTGPSSGTITTAGTTGPALGPGTFYVCVTAQNTANCSVSPQYCEMMTIPVVPSPNCQGGGLAALGNEPLALSIAPNPNGGAFWVFCPNELAGQIFRIFSADGRMVLAGELQAGEQSLHLPQAEKGLYVLNAESYSLKFVIE